MHADSAIPQYLPYPTRNRTIATAAWLIAALVFLLSNSPVFAQAGTNLALGAPVTMSSADPGGPAANCVDGSAGDYCQTGVSGSGGITNQWVDVDLLGDHPIQQIVLDNTGATCCRITDHRLLIVAGDSSLPRPANPAAVYANPRYYAYAYANGANGTIGANTPTSGGTAAGATWTTLTVPTGLRKAAWLRIFQLDNSAATGTGRLGFNEIRVLRGVPFQRYLVNANFEQPVLPNLVNSSYFGTAATANGAVPGWSTTDQSNTFEYFTPSGCGGAGSCGYVIPPFSGSQFVELNTFVNSSVSQSICVFPGESFQWALAHHWRTGAMATPDVAKLTIDGADIARFSDNGVQNATTATSDHACTLLGGAAAASATCSSQLPPPATSTATGWAHWGGNWTNPATNASPKAVTFEIGAVSTATGGINLGNFLDAFNLQGLAALVDFSSPTSSGPETIPGANLPTLVLNGIVPTASSVDVVFSGSAVLGQHYTTSSGTNTVTVSIPAGTYDGTTATAISLTPYVQIIADGAVHSPSDTLRMMLTNLGPGVRIGNGQNCTLGTNPTDYTILDVAPQLGVQKSTPATTVTPNGTITYTVVFSNTGSVDAGGTVVADAIPAGIASFAWTCTTAGGAVCPNVSGTGAINETIATFPAGGSLVYTVSALVSASPPASLSNSATATLPSARCTPGNSPAPCIATSVIDARPALRIDKGTSSSVAAPGGTVNYTINITNAGSVGLTAASSSTFTDSLPAGITALSWTCQAFGGATCPNASGSGAISETITSMPRGSRLTYSVLASVSNTPPASIVNTAQITPPNGGGSCAANGNADPCTDSVTLSAAPKILLQKSTSTSSLTPGGTVNYSVVLTNTGNVPANGTTISDPIPTGLTTPFTWTCSAAGGAVCPNASGSGAITETIATLPASGSVTYAISATVVGPTAPTLVTNTATANPPTGGVCDPANSAPPCTAAAALSPVPIVSLRKSASTAVLIPNTNVTFTLVARNVSNRSADGTTISDPVPAGLTFTSWSCTASGGATCALPAGTGAITQVIPVFPSGGEVIYTINATVSASPPASITNTASETPTNNGACFPGNTAPPCTSAATLTRPPQLSVQKTSSTGAVTPNGTITYQVVVTNTGTSSAAGALINDPIPIGLVSFNWTCAASGGAVCPHASGSGGIGEAVVTFPPGGALTYSITATVSGNPPASITNTARATPPNDGTCAPGSTQPPCAASASTPPVPVIDLQKTTSASVIVPGGTVTYTVTATNVGDVNANGSVISDPIPAGLTTPFTWTCAGSNGAVCPNASGSGAINETIATYPAAGSLTYTITATVVATPPPFIDNVASAQLPASGGLCAPDNSVPPCRANVQLPTAPIVRFEKTTSASVATPGGSVTYTITATNIGNADAGGTVIADPIPAGLTTPFTWTCASAGGAVCTASGSGAINETIATFPPGGSVTYTVTAAVAANPPATVTNAATAQLPNSGVCAPGNSPGPCTASVALPAAPRVGISKTASAPVFTPGGTVTYTVVVSNAGSVAAPNTLVSDPVPSGVTTFAWACASSGGATCPNASGSGAINETIATFPAGSAVTYTITAGISANPPNPITNTATATPTNGVCAPANTAPPCSSSVSAPPAPQISISKSVNPSALTPGGTAIYTVVVSNTGAVPAPNVLVDDPVPAGITAFAWTCAGGACPNASGSGAVNETIASLPVGASVVYTINASVSAAPPSLVTNTATANLPGGYCLPGNTAAPCSASVSTPPQAQVSVTKTADTNILVPGGTVTYTIVVANTGSVAAPNTVVADPVPTGITAFGWTCAGSGGGACPNASGSGAINETIATLPAGANVTYTVTATVGATPPAQITNTATANPPNGVCTPGNTPPPCSGSVSTPPGPQVSITKTANTTILTPGGSVVYTVVVANTGSVAAPNTVVADPMPTGITAFGWTCAGSGGAICPNASGSGAINETIATLPAGASVTYTVTATVSATPPAQITNTATANPPNGVCTPGNTPPPCSGSVSTPPGPQVSITKTANTTILTPGGSVVYTVVVANTGSVAAPNTTVSDPVPTGITAFAWTCASAGGALCPNASGSGAINETIATLPAGASVTYTVTATVSATPPAQITNKATANPPNGVCTPGNTPPPCSGSVSTPPGPQISITKTADVSVLTPGGTVTYTIVVSNAGSVAAPDTSVSDAVPPGITAFAWTCASTGGAVCPNVSGTGAINETIATLPTGASVTYTVSATVSATPPAQITNTATAALTNGVCMPGNTPAPCSSSASVGAGPQFSLTKTANTTVLTPGGSVVYTVVVANTGSVAAPNTVVADPMPTGITAFAWTCAGAGGAICPNASGSGAINETIATFPSGASVTYTVTATVSATPPAQITNTATANPPNGVCTPGNTPPPCSGSVSTPPGPQVSVTKTANTTVLTPGGNVTYTIVIANTGSVDAPNTPVSDPVPSGITAFAWTCASAGGAVCPTASGSGAISETIATLPAGATVTYTVNATISANPPAQITNTATANPPNGVCAPGNTPPPCRGSASVPPGPQVSVTKTVDTTVLTPGGTATYTVVIANTGSVDAPNTPVSDPIPAGITAFAWTCASAGGAVCPNASGSGAINETIATFPSGASVTYTVTATVSANPPAQITNTATANPPNGVCTPGNTPAPCSGSASVPPGPQISVTKTADATVLTPGGSVTYTIVVGNVGSVDAPNTPVSDPVPSGITAFAWTCASAGGAVCPTASGGGAISETIATFPAGSSVTYTVSATVSANPPAQVTNIATVTPANGVCAPGNTPPPCSGSASVPPMPQISVSKTANTSLLIPGGSVTYTIVVSNTGNVDAMNAVVSDPLPPNITAFAWTCAGAACPNASGSGAISETIVNLPAGAMVTYTVNASISATATGQVTNTVAVSMPGGSAMCLPSGAAAPCQSSATGYLRPIAPVPALSPLMLLLLLLSTAVVGVRWMRFRFG